MSTTTVPSGFGKYLATCSPTQISDFLKKIQSAQVQVAPETQSQTQSMPVHLPGAKRSKKTTAFKITKKKPTVPHPRAALPGTDAVGHPVAKRPLNSWMAFRSYYSPIFSSYQQKEISGLMRSLWQADPFKAKWSILAKAYSIIRDYKGKSLAPLDEFLAVVGFYIGIIPPGEYLSALGWEVAETTGVKNMNRKFMPDNSTFDEHLRTSNLSVEDIVSYCRETGYFVENELSSIGAEPSSALTYSTLTMATQPTAALVVQSDHFSIGGGLVNLQPVLADAARQPAVTSNHAINISIDPSSNTSNTAQVPLSIVVPDASTVLEPLDNSFRTSDFIPDGFGSFASQGLQGFAAGMEVFDKMLADTQEQGLVRVHAIAADAEMRKQIQALKDSQAQFPFNSQFDPANLSDMDFNPAIGDGFNTYNISNFNFDDFMEPGAWNV
ncbi:mating-type protein MAT alpha 1-domain-containing protein [Cryomyces antarcticus]